MSDPVKQFAPADLAERLQLNGGALALRTYRLVALAGELCQCELAHLLQIEESVIEEILDELEKKQFLIRLTQNDNRYYSLPTSLTEGESIRKKIFKSLSKAEEGWPDLDHLARNMTEPLEFEC